MQRVPCQLVALVRSNATLVLTLRYGLWTLRQTVPGIGGLQAPVIAECRAALDSIK
jgi:hypothetical protein